MQKNTQKNTAFTMVELMATLLIIGILVGIAVVSYNFYISKSRMAEATITMDALAKAEVTYYISHKEFVSFRVPFDVVTLNYWVPSGGDKLRVDSTKGSSTASCGTNCLAPWAAIGSPLQDGTMVSFYYEALAGKNNAAGTTLTGTSPFDFIDPNAATSGVALNVENPYVPYGRCILDFNKSLYQPNIGVADKSWVTIYAIANFNNNSNDAWTPGNGQSADPASTECSQVTKYIETNTSGNVSTGRPPIVQYFGH